MDLKEQHMKIIYLIIIIVEMVDVRISISQKLDK